MFASVRLHIAAVNAEVSCMAVVPALHLPCGVWEGRPRRRQPCEVRRERLEAVRDMHSADNLDIARGMRRFVILLRAVHAGHADAHTSG